MPTLRQPHAMQRTHALIAVVLLVALAGCVSVTAELTVDEDGDVAMDAEMEFDEMVVNLMEMEVEEDPEYDSVGEALIDDMEEDEADDFDNVVFDYEELDDGGLLLEMSSDPTDPADLEDIEVTVDEDAETVEFISHDGIEDGADDDLNGEFDEFADEIEMTIAVTMPGEVTDHNGEQVDDTTVEWTNEDHAGTETLEVASELDSNGSITDRIPGFTGAIAALALLGAALLAYRRR